jgi:hypothetical protein
MNEARFVTTMNVRRISCIVPAGAARLSGFNLGPKYFTPFFSQADVTYQIIQFSLIKRLWTLTLYV